VVNSAFGLVLVPVYARHLKANQFGVLSLLTITLTLITIILKFGLNHAFFRHFYETEDEQQRRRIVGSTLVFLLGTSLVLCAALYMAAPAVSRVVFPGEAGRADLLRLVFLISFFEVITLVPDSILRARFKSATYSVLNIVAFGVQIFLIAYLVIAVEASVENVLIGRLIAAAFESALFFFVVRRDLSLSFSAPELRQMLTFGAPLIFSQIAFTLFMMIDRFFLQRYSGDREVGFYSMANTLVSVVTVLVTVPFSQVWTVMRFSVMNEEGALQYYARVLTYIVLVSMFLALGVAAVAGDGLMLFAGRGYWPAAPLIPLLAFSAVLDSAARVLNVGITLRKRTIWAPLVIAVALAVNVGLNFLLIPKHGAMGATVSTLLSFVVFCALRHWASNRLVKVHYEWGRVFTVATVGAAFVACFYLSDHLRGDLSGLAYGDPKRTATLWLSALVKASLALSFPLVLLALGFYTENERRRVSDAWAQLRFVVKHRRWKEALE
jgi:O-antigen/teichoic acid export membrane protein